MSQILTVTLERILLVKLAAFCVCVSVKICGLYREVLLQQLQGLVGYLNSQNK